MFFIALLIAATTAIAAAAAYFSVYGLAYTFAGVFWSVVVMGASLEAGKLVAASYLYRYWDTTHALLKYYLMAGVLGLMVMTSTGIFGYLSSGYQQDVLPLKQKTEQVRLLEEEKGRALARKKQIDDILSSGTAAINVQKGDGLDRNAARVLNANRVARESTAKQFKAEQAEVNARVRELDTELLGLKQELIKVEAHIGPITYIAKAFNLDSDNATKYLIFLIIFTFDPMAVALTLAVNNALRLRKEEKAAKEKPVEAEPAPVTVPVATIPDVIEVPNPPVIEQPTPAPEPEPQPVKEVKLEPVVEEAKPEPVVEPPVQPEPAIIVQQPTDVEPIPRIKRPYAGTWSQSDLNDPSGQKIQELMDYRRFLLEKQTGGEALTQDETWMLEAINNVLKKQRLDIYV